MPPKLEVSLVAFDELPAEDLRGWNEIESSATAVNPFLTPTWVETWFDAYVAPADRQVFLVRQGSDGPLVGVAPVYVDDTRLGPLRVARRLLPAGARAGTPFEIPGHLSRAGFHRDVTREIVAASLALGVDWSTISLAPEQGWFEPEHLLGQGGRGTFWQELRSRACVVLPIAETWDQTRAGLKRNIKESLRRSRNRMKNAGTTFETRWLTGDELDVAVVDRFLELHRYRSGNGKATIEHPDAYADPRTRQIMRQALPRLARESRASVVELVADGVVAASQVVLHAPGCTYVHSSGFLPEYWDLSPLTYLVGAVAEQACVRGDKVLNFSPGPRVSKLRWSEDVWVAHEFGFGAGPGQLLRRYSVLRAAAMLRPASAGVAWTPPPPSSEVQSVGS